MGAVQPRLDFHVTPLAYHLFTYKGHTHTYGSDNVASEHVGRTRPHLDTVILTGLPMWGWWGFISCTFVGYPIKLLSHMVCDCSGASCGQLGGQVGGRSASNAV